MINTKFEAYKLRRELQRSGTDYIFKRPQLNKFKEPTDEQKTVGVIAGLYHETNRDPYGGVFLTTADATQHRTKRTPMILCLHEDVSALKLQVGDQVTINSKTMKVTGVINVQEWNIVADIALEVVDDGLSN